jgi:hypothetical protein
LSDIFQEVEEDVRRERYEKLWKDYGNYIIALASVLVLAVAGYQAWTTYELNQRRLVSDRYQAAEELVRSGDPVKAEAAFGELAKDAPTGYATLAKFQLSAALLAQGKRDPAVALLRELVNSSDSVISEAARLRLAWTIADGTPRAEIVALLAPLNMPDSPWRAAAAEVLAYLDFVQGSRSDAQAAYAKLADDPTAPASLRQRAAAIAAYLKANPTAVPATAPAPPSSTPPASAAAAPARGAAAPAPAAAAPARGAATPARPAAPAPAQRTRTP